MEGRDKQDVVVRLNLIGFFAFELPVGIVNEHQNAGAAVQVSMQVDEKRDEDGKTYMWLSRTNSSARGSFMKFLHKCWMRKAILAGWPPVSTAGSETE